MPTPTFREKQFGRIDSFADLEDGWLWGEGKAIPESVRERAKRFLTEATFLPEEYATAPTEDGGVLIEFDAGRWDVSVEILPEGKSLAYGHDLEGEEEEEFECNFPDDQCHQLLPWLNEKVAS